VVGAEPQCMTKFLKEQDLAYYHGTASSSNIQ
jgi:hypothetical protein